MARVAGGGDAEGVESAESEELCLARREGAIKGTWPRGGRLGKGFFFFFWWGGGRDKR